jgi:hypothetical protein
MPESGRGVWAPHSGHLKSGWSMNDLDLRVFVVRCRAGGDPLPVTLEGHVLRMDRARMRFVDILADALDVAALRGSVGYGTRGSGWTVRHAAGS